mmetsp:Transcript_21008/g.49909  ORF Transcript_21008/g.49909 Transcript_21008/m.49909 type:complete len:105 (+) Transcript_21008:215-529(+)
MEASKSNNNGTSKTHLKLNSRLTTTERVHNTTKPQSTLTRTAKSKKKDNKLILVVRRITIKRDTHRNQPTIHHVVEIGIHYWRRGREEMEGREEDRFRCMCRCL